ncbi:peptide methionine sulfoxide reductase MsrA/MsrB [Methanobrevibacter cuticularis]|uniref:Multifunctional fusion protein n=1 Tax=Methanobrevibacter cuticularis TaxID=47311 RepID=A0A166CPN8_9EURY|nr:peptide-methionine (S)-S-oxide reductase MsrA [Methanobrevibacter cuticularis]KZX15877.1 peptide methionine sulfoxide reductase MsrA/MsrB [Methanobrevibacter cuticularis]
MPENPNENIEYDENNLRTIYLAGGCFWGIEAYMSRLLGIAETVVGYGNGETTNPSYEEVCNLDTGHAETVKIKYDPNIISLTKILEEFFKIIDPTSLNRQGGDIGTQYRTGIYYSDSEDLVTITKAIENEQKKHKSTVVTEVEPIETFFEAENYHQKYLEKNPRGYCHIDLSLLPEDILEIEDSSTELIDDYDFYDCNYKNFTPEEKEAKLKELKPIEFNVTQKNATEPPFTGEYNDFNEEGLYVDVVSGEPLFTSLDKFDSECGWPSFTKPIASKNIIESEDNSHGMTRTELKSSVAKSHLGHVFDDGPKKQGGQRYCINSAALRFIPVSKLEKEGYVEYIDVFKNKK